MNPRIFLLSRRPKLRTRSVLVNLFSGNALSGVCVYAGRDALVLRGVTVHEPNTDPVAADGEVLVDRASVDFIQLL